MTATPPGPCDSSAAGASLTTLPLHSIPDLPHALQRLLKQIPRGRVTTYGELARALGDIGAARWVGEYLAAHPHDDGCPCHRVVRSTGDVGLYVTRHSADKTEKLRQEGVNVADGRVDLSRFSFNAFRSSAPLAALCELQQRIPGQLRMVPLQRTPQHVGGVDVSYVSRTEAVAAFVLVDVPSCQLVWSASVRADVTFPYISGYLSFRELPILLKLFEAVRSADRVPDVTFVDGNGILHPRRAGSASCFGLAAGTPTIGVGKKLLCGRVDANECTEELADECAGLHVQRIVHNDEPVGFAVQAGPKNRPFFVSPGHLTDLSTALSATRLVLGNRRLPLPIAFADRESRKEAQRIKAQKQQPR